MTTWLNLVFQFILIALALFGGLAAASHGQGTDLWRTALLSVGALSLGFGAAVLIYRRLNNSTGENLELAYKDLSERAGLLLNHAQLFERKLDEQQKTAVH